MITTSTAQYTAVAVNTACLVAVVHKEMVVAKVKMKADVMDTVALRDRGTEEKMETGVESKAVEASATRILIKAPTRYAE